MKESIEKLTKFLEEFPQKLSEIPESETEIKPTPAKWSKKEILGHLIDSASNNHQRFVRTQQASHLLFPPYSQDHWIRNQHYQTESWKNLVSFWESYNRHLLHIISNIPEDKLENHCVIGTDPPKTLAFLIEDYVNHLEHHLEQIL